MLDYLASLSEKIKKAGLYPDLVEFEGSSTDIKARIKGRVYLVFCSNNYLGISNSESVKLEAQKALSKYGLSSGGSRLISGNLDIHNNLERELAKFLGRDSVVAFLSGYMANVGIIPAITKSHKLASLLPLDINLGEKSWVIFSDEFNHASLIDACKLSGSEVEVYKHKDIHELSDRIEARRHSNRLVITDGVFSMDGDLAPLENLVKLCEDTNTLLYLDDAHGCGVLGENGRGSPEIFGLEERIKLYMGTFTKAFGAVGGFIACSAPLADYFRVTAHTYIFSAPLPPVVSGGLIQSIALVREKERRERLQKNSKHIREGLLRLGFELLGDMHIIPVLIGDEKKAIAFARRLFDNFIFAPAVRWPAVPRQQARLRITSSSNYTVGDINVFLNVMEKVGKELKIIK